jgi:hypothetical protein
MSPHDGDLRRGDSIKVSREAARMAASVTLLRITNIDD